ncbi:NAD-dependent epimerase/dehydratase [Acidilobus saccharovorans 345-15]|uniref:NAD-dependent epimerase/dehydratase n=1 Tax=Acidilobus saccharovorans (strain DSM 16705 / JCM 18335 / VKM B-2471 / 345-15) TaxID=666510 RepID=D9PZI4_ACIS3|nr:GDP-mannose 4,6-dehydratase [Acidilobus saccharovorans]ADL18472.1 NAD-dependent epimerase/dehydratase [Acidilobus saccharovorans 345-15]
MKFIVTGGAGFIGSNLSRLLLSEGHDVIVVDDLSSGARENVPAGARLVIGDVSDRRALEGVEAMARGDEVAIVHLAAVSGVVEAREDPSRAVRANVLGTQEVLDMARRLDAYVTIASSAAVYGDVSDVPVKEDAPLRPTSLYGLTKLFDEQLAEQAYRDYGLRSSYLRLFNVYGPGMRRGPYASVIYNFMEAAIRGLRPVIYGDGLNTRDFVYVDDVARAFVEAVRRRATGPFNVGTGREVSVLDLLRLISKVAGVELRPEFREPRPGDIRRSCADVSRARESLGWEPRVSLEEGLRLTYSYMRERLRP